ncbi:elongator complex protein 5 [Halictus rubicundus]|uniref:elongator complex protein 5 n=1 Tax=Halictus rubicundus TaxID=77578 RepID=UPI0040365C13
MMSIRTLPLLEGAKFIVLDEGSDAMYARKLIAGWIQMWKDKDASLMFDLLLFSDPKSTYEHEPKAFGPENVNIRDYYTVDINQLDASTVNNKDFDNLEHILKTTETKSTVIVDCLTSLILFVGLSKALWFVEKLSKQVPQLICIYRRDFMQSRIPCVNSLGTTYVRIERCHDVYGNNNFNYIVDIIHRKLILGGTVVRHNELVTQSSISYEIQSKKIETNKRLDAAYKREKQKIESSFKIEISEHEMKQREETVLPYTINSNPTNTSKILYQPEDIDDIDEEDPDDDLCI